jgi:hypothetical protein
MREEGEHSRPGSIIASGGDHVLKQLLVAKVDAIKHAYGQVCRPLLLHLL